MTAFPDAVLIPARPVPVDQALQFQRGRRRVRKAKRNFALRFGHLVGLLFLTGGLFFGVQRAAFYVFDWEYFDVKNIEISALHPEVRSDVESLVSRALAVNILLFDSGRVEEELRRNRWVKDVRLRKVLPSSLRVEVVERVPFALLDIDRPTLVDPEGILLGEPSSRTENSLPVLVDSRGFKRDVEEKVRTAADFLSSLTPEDRNNVAVVDLTLAGSLSFHFRNDRTRVILGDSHSAEKVVFYKRNLARWEALYGELEYIDLRLPDRTTLRPLSTKTGGTFPGPEKEVL